MNFQEMETIPSDSLAIWLKAEDERSIESAPMQLGQRSTEGRCIARLVSCYDAISILFWFGTRLTSNQSVDAPVSSSDLDVLPAVLRGRTAPVVVPVGSRESNERSAVRVVLSACSRRTSLIEKCSLAVVNVTSGRGSVLGLGGGGSRSRGLGGGGSNVGGSRGRSDVDRGRGGSLVSGRGRSGGLVSRRSGLLGGRGRSDGLLGGARGGGGGGGGSGGVRAGEDGQGGGLLGVGVGDDAQVLTSGRGDVGNTSSDRGSGTDELLREATRFSTSKSCARRRETRLGRLTVTAASLTQVAVATIDSISALTESEGRQ